MFFASDFIAEKNAAAAANSASARRRRPRRRACSTDARKAERVRERGRERDHERGHEGGRAHEPAARHRIGNNAAACRSSDGKRAVPQSSHGRFESEEEDDFLEESASALLLLHSRFFCGVREEEGIVCRLCVLCREAGWMGDPLRPCPDLDPLVLETMVSTRLRSTDRCDAGRQRNSGSGYRQNNLSSQVEDEVFSFEAFYRVLAGVAILVYPREGKAMQRLLLEGVLPLAADNEPRIWSSRYAKGQFESCAIASKKNCLQKDLLPCILSLLFVRKLFDIAKIRAGGVAIYCLRGWTYKETSGPDVNIEKYTGNL